MQRSYGSTLALQGLSLTVDRGEVVGLLGPNGAGKSTLLRVLGTLVTPDAGVVEVAGIDAVAHPAAVRARTGVMIGDERSVYWRLSGRRNLHFYAALHGLRRDLAATWADELLARVGLSAVADRPVRTYSSGMRARLALARALIGEPPVLLLDEPTRSLDPMAAAEFRSLTAELRKHGHAVLLATHSLEEAAAVADRIVIVDHGRVVHEAAGAAHSVESLRRAFAAAVQPSGGSGGQS